MRAAFIAITIALLLAGGCRKSTETSTVANDQISQAASLTPEQLGEIGAKINKQPNDAQKILNENGLTDESFEQAIRKVSEDPEASKKYAEAYKRANA